MLYFWVSFAYALVNLGLAAAILARSRRNLLSKFYAFCVATLLLLGVAAHLLTRPGHGIPVEVLRVTTAFLYSVFPFFFLHFMLVFVRRYEILRSKRIIFANYFAGIFSYTLVLLGYVPVPFAETGVSAAGYIYYLTWMSILFSIGVALAYSVIGGFSEHGGKTNLLFAAFVVLMLLLPTPFTLLVFSVVSHDSFIWYFLSSTAALTVVVFIVFRHRITMNTPYQTMRTAIAAMNDVLIKTDRDLRIELAQGSVLGLLGYGEPELRGRPFAEILAAPDLLEGSRVRLLTEKSRSELLETEVVCNDGTHLPMDFSLTPVFVNEEITGFAAVGRNVAEQRRAERLKEVAYQIAQAADAADTLDALYRSVHEIVGGVLPVEHFMIALLDAETNLPTYPYSSPGGAGDHAAVPPFPSLAEKILRSGEPLLCDEESLRGPRIEQRVPGGAQAIWLGVPLRVHEATIGVMAVGNTGHRGRYGPDELRMLEYVSTQVARSIDRKRAEDALRVSEENYRRIFDEDLAGNATTDADGCILTCNSSFLRMFGFRSAEEALGSSITALYRDPEVRTTTVGLLRRRRRLIAYEQDMCRRDGQAVHTVQNIVGIFDDRDRLSQILFYMIDDTERNLLETQLRQAQKMENLGAMAGGIAHDFNNILTIMSVHLSMIRPGHTRGERAETAFDALAKAVRRGAGLVSQLLTFARKTDVLYESVNVNYAIAELARMLEATLPKSIAIDLRFADDLPTIAADPNQLHQALLNLCVNARDAMSRGGTLTVTTRLCRGPDLRTSFPDAEPDPYVAIDVSDTGDGMDQATRSRIFEPFFTTKEKGKGTGLGLAVVYGVVKGHRGFIDVQSQPGQGTTFTLYFHAPDRGITAALEADQALDTGAPVTGTILLVEDEKLVRESVKTLLEERGFTVLTAGDGEEAVDVFTHAHASIDLVLTDLGLPRRGGWEAFLAMRAIDPELEGIFATGYIDPAVKADMISQGARHFLQKPYSTSGLIARIRAVLAGEGKPQ